MSVEGELTIEIGDEVRVTSSRPVFASRILIGKSPQQALDVIPLLFNVCDIAQARAGLLAMQKRSEPAQETARDILVLVETAREHLLRVLLDYPKLFGFDMSSASLPEISQLNQLWKKALFKEGNAFGFDCLLDIDEVQCQLLIGQLETIMQKDVFHCSTSQWLEIDDLSALENWVDGCDSGAAISIKKIGQQEWYELGDSDCLSLPELSSADLIKRFDSPNANAFIAQPSWNDKCYESTVLNRHLTSPLISHLLNQFNKGLITRWLARLVEMASIPSKIKTLLNQLTNNNTSIKNNNQGIAQVEAARGHLIHRVKIKNNLIENYQILAPTEWNFHPQGLIKQALSNIKPKKTEQLARIIINAIDPCVGYQLRLT